MNNYSLGGRYSKSVLTHFEKFIRNQNLFNKTRPLMLSVSGGVDSMVLLDLVNKLKRFGYSNSLRVITFNHNTRDAQSSEVKNVHNFSSLLGIETIVVNLQGLKTSKNFEAMAREKRYEVIESYLMDDELCLLGQHIDDSYEWHLLQQSKSSNLISSIGIPLVNDYKVRPLMCLTKKQIQRYAMENEIPYITDPTNDETKYERNYLRNEVIPLIEKRHPKYLKHYTYLMTDLSRKLNVLHQKENFGEFVLVHSENHALIYCASENKQLINKDLLLEAIKILSPSSRSNLSKQIQVLQETIANGKLGPHRLPGSIKAYTDFNCILFVKDGFAHVSNEASEFLNLNYFEFKTYLKTYLRNVKHSLSFPFIVELNDSSFKKKKIKFSYKSERALYLKDNNINYYPALKLLREWSKKKNKTKKVKLRFLK